MKPHMSRGSAQSDVDKQTLPGLLGQSPHSRCNSRQTSLPPHIWALFRSPMSLWVYALGCCSRSLQQAEQRLRWGPFRPRTYTSDFSLASCLFLPTTTLVAYSVASGSSAQLMSGQTSQTKWATQRLDWH